MQRWSSADAIRELIDGTSPVPSSLDLETAAAVRRLLQHFRDHGCLTWTPAPSEDGR